MSILQNSNAISAGGGYDINNSLRFRSSASAYLERIIPSTTNRKTWTWSGWVKRGILGSDLVLFRSWDLTSSYSCRLTFLANNTIDGTLGGSTSTLGSYTTNAVFRDPSAWYHIVLAVDTTQATSTNRIKLYINNVQQTFSAYSADTQNVDTQMNLSGTTFDIGKGLTYFDGYLTEVNFIDGQALTPSSFGETDTTTGVWKPKAYTGTYGTNGFYLKFSDIATTSGSNAGLGKDFSGNGNYWTTNNISVTSGTTYDAMTDVPTLTSATVANYATLNPLNSLATCSDANLKSTAGASYIDALSTIACDAGSNKWYFEATLLSLTSINAWVGITKSTNSGLDHNAVDSYRTVYQANGAVYRDGTGLGTTSTGVTYTTNDIIGIALDSVSGSISFYKNNTLINTTTDNLYSSNSWFFYTGQNNSSWAVNFGQRPFTYTPPTGYKALNTYNLPDSTIKKGNSYMDATLYTGTGATKTVTNASGFYPDLLWIKSRSNATNNDLFMSVIGPDNYFKSNLTDGVTATTNSVTAFNSNGFTLGSDSNSIGVNINTNTYVAWQWLANPASYVTNTNGSITSYPSVNSTSGFSIVYWTGTAANGTLGHGLGVAPKFIITKCRGGSTNWGVYHASLGNTKAMFLNSSSGSLTSSTYWNNTSPTSSVFSVGSSNDTNAATAMVAFCWAEIAGFSKISVYTGNSSADGPFIYTGFKPKFVIIADVAGNNWYTLDSVRNTYNVVGNYLFPNTSGAELDLTGSYPLDFLSNGFKIRNASYPNGTATNIYIAFAENPFKNSLAR